MSKNITRGQILELVSRFATTTRWDELDADGIQREVIGLTPDELGGRFTDFLRNGARVLIGELKNFSIDRKRIFAPELFFGQSWRIWRGPIDGKGLEGDEAQDARSLALTSLDLSRLRFEACLKEKEISIKGEEKLRRLMEETPEYIRLDAMVGQQLFEEPGHVTLEWLRLNRGVTWIDFPGTILRSPGGSRCVLCLCWSGGPWRWRYRWLADGWYRHYPSGLLANCS